MSWKFDCLDDWRSVWEGPYRSAWDSAFHPDSGARVSPFGHPEVVRAWIDAVGTDRLRPVFVVGRHVDGRQAFHLLVSSLKPGRRSRILESVGGDEFDYSEPVVLPSADGRNTLDASFWPALKALLLQSGRYDSVLLPRVPGSALDQPPRFPAREVAPYVELRKHPSCDAYIASRSKSFRQNIRKAPKRLPDLVLRTYTVEEYPEVREWIPRAIVAKGERIDLRQKAGRLERYLKRLTETDLPAGMLVCSALELNGATVAWSVDFCLHRTYYRYFGVYDRAFAAQGLGTYHDYLLFKFAYDEDFEFYDLLWGDEPYKDRWTDGVQETLHEVRLDSARLESRLRRGADAVALRARKVLQPSTRSA